MNGPGPPSVPVVRSPARPNQPEGRMLGATQDRIPIVASIVIVTLPAATSAMISRRRGARARSSQKIAIGTTSLS